MTDAPARGTSTTAVGGRRHADFSRAVLDDLYRYRPKRLPVARLLWLVTGILGGHRFYLGRTVTGLIMLFTGGGALIWWIIDAFLLRGMVGAYNDEQATRERSGLPPIALDFMPSARGSPLGRWPGWAAKRSGRRRLAGDLLVLITAGAALGGATARTGNFEGLTAILALIAITNLGARWETLAHLPLLQSLDRWSHRLRLFYHVNDPGGPLSLLVRPVIGPYLAIFRKKARAEVKLYLELGAVFVIVFTLLDLLEAGLVSGGGFGIDAGVLIGDMVSTFVTVYAFAAPIGATLTTHLLLEKKDFVLWALSGVSLLALGAGLIGG